MAKIQVLTEKNCSDLGICAANAKDVLEICRGLKECGLDMSHIASQAQQQYDVSTKLVQRFPPQSY